MPEKPKRVSTVEQAALAALEDVDIDVSEEGLTREDYVRILQERLQSDKTKGMEAAKIVEVLLRVNPLPTAEKEKLESLQTKELMRLMLRELVPVLKLYGHRAVSGGVFVEPEKKEEKPEAVYLRPKRLPKKRRPRKRKTGDPLTKEQAQKVRASYKSGMTLKQLSKKHNVSVPYVMDILDNKRHPDEHWTPTKRKRGPKPRPKASEPGEDPGSEHLLQGRPDRPDVG